MSRDPIGFAGGLNLYEYAANSPVDTADPLGLYGIDTALMRQGATEFLGGLGISLADPVTPGGEVIGVPMMASGGRKFAAGLGLMALTVGTGGDQPRTDTDTRDRRRRKGDIFFERFGSKEEAVASDAADKLLPRPCHEGNEKWIAEVGKQNWKNLGNPKYHDWKMTIRARPSARLWLQANAYLKPNEPWAYGIPGGKLDEFNFFIKEITISSARPRNGRYNK